MIDAREPGRVGWQVLGCGFRRTDQAILSVSVRFLSEEVFDNPTGWVAAHVRRYAESGGRRGHRFNAREAAAELPVVIVERA